MSDSLYKVIQLVGSSTKSWEDAVQRAVTDAAKTLRDLRVVTVDELDCKIEDEMTLTKCSECGEEIDDKAKVIMLTGVRDKGVIKVAKKYGASDYITKPFSLEHLEKEVMPKILKQLL